MSPRRGKAVTQGIAFQTGGYGYGTIFGNVDVLTAEGYLCVQDGGQLNDEGGAIVNNGTIDLISYYNGDISAIAGAGTLNDNREN